MRATHTSLPSADHALHFIEFDSVSCYDHDLLQLPHHVQPLFGEHKREAEHLAGRIATVHALCEFGLKTIPGIGTQRQPVWPWGLFGGINHSASTALAVVSRQPAGIDIETIFMPQTATELTSSIVTHIEKELLANNGLPIEQALTLAFSTKGGVFKATRTPKQAGTEFTQYQIMVLQHGQMILRTHHQTYCAQRRFSDNDVVTLATV